MRLVKLPTAALMVFLPMLLSCAGTLPAHLATPVAELEACPSTPNCVSSASSEEASQIEPLRLAVAPDAAWQALRKAVSELPRTRVVTDQEGYLHAESRSALIGYVDDLELMLRADDGEIIDIRSASRVGRSDLGVNRQRVESLRQVLMNDGVIR